MDQYLITQKIQFIISNTLHFSIDHVIKRIRPFKTKITLPLK